jgi:hypothetical protein
MSRYQDHPSDEVERTPEELAQHQVKLNERFHANPPGKFSASSICTHYYLQIQRNTLMFACCLHGDGHLSDDPKKMGLCRLHARAPQQAAEAP